MTDIITSIAASKGIKTRLLLPNAFSDGFCCSDGVGLTSANYLQDTAIGRVYPTIVLSMIPQATGTAFGNGTDLGGLAASFDGVAPQIYSASSRGPALGTALYVGKNYSASPKRIAKATVYATSNLGFDSSGSATTYTLALYGKNGSAPSGGTNGTLLATATGADAASAVVDLISNDTITAYDYVWVRVYTALGAEYYIVAEVQFYEPSTATMALVTAPHLIDIVPVSIKGGLIIRPFETMALGTDMVVRLSRDGGAHWTGATLVQIHTLGQDRYIEIEEADVSGQPTGSSIVAEITINNKSCEVRGIYIEGL